MAKRAASVESELGIPPGHLLITATHTHSAPGQPPGSLSLKVVEAIRAAEQTRVPARMG